MNRPPQSTKDSDEIGGSVGTETVPRPLLPQPEEISIFAPTPVTQALVPVHVPVVSQKRAHNLQIHKMSRKFQC